MEQLQRWRRNVSGMIAGMNRRERILVNSALVFIAVFLLARFVLIPLFGQQTRLEKTLAAKGKTLREMTVLQQEAAVAGRGLSDAAADLAVRDKDFTLFSFLDQLAGEAGVKDAITYMKPSTEESEQGSFRLSLVELKLESVSLESLVAYIHKIETARKMVFVKRLSISRQEKDIGGVDAVMQVITVTG